MNKKAFICALQATSGKTVFCKKKKERRVMKICNLYKVMGVMSLLSLFSCAKDDPHNTPHPDKGAVQVTADWSGRSTEAPVPGSYTLCIGEESQVVTAETNTFRSLLAPGSYRLLVYNIPEGISVTGHTATVDTEADGTLTPQPGYLFSATSELNVIADDTLKATLTMQQYTRSLVLALELAEGDKERIAGTAARLTGIANSLDLVTGEQTDGQTGKTVVPEFKFSTLAPAEDKPALTTTLRLVGVVKDEQQILTLDVTLTDGTVHTITTNLTEALKNLGDNVEALVLDAALNLPTSANASATITEWKEVNNGNITIH